MTSRPGAARIGVLSDGDITLRPFETTDRPAVLVGRDEIFHQFMGEGSPDPAPTACVTVADGGDELVVGWIDFDDEREWLAVNEVNVGYSIFPSHRGNGYASKAVVLLEEYLASLSPPLDSSLLIDPDNAASIAVAARAGFRHVDTIGDQLLFRPER